MSFFSTIGAGVRAWMAGRNRTWSAVTDRLDFLDGLRGLAALFIVCHHSYCLVELVGRTPPDGAQFLRYGHFVVSLFIMLSGYCLALPLLSSGGLRGGAWGFLKRRARRILPPYYAAVGVCLAISALVSRGLIGMTGFIPVTPAGLLSHLLLVNNVWGNTSHTVFGDPTLSGVFWSTAVEWQISLAFPFLAWLWKRFHPLAVVPAVGVLAYGVQHFTAGTVWVGLSAPYYLLFAVGMLAATVVYAPGCSALRRYIPWAALCAVCFAGFCVVAVHQGYDTLAARFDLADLLFAPFAFSLLVAASRLGKLQRVLSWKPITAVGGFSYSLYLLHEPVLKVIFGNWLERPVARFSGAVPLLITIAIAAPLSIIACRVFYQFCEKPWIRKKTPKVIETAPTPASVPERPREDKPQPQLA